MASLSDAMYSDTVKPAYDFMVGAKLKMIAAQERLGATPPGTKDMVRFTMAMADCQQAIGEHTAYFRVLKEVWGSDCDWDTLMKMAQEEAYARHRKEGVYREQPKPEPVQHKPAVPVTSTGTEQTSLFGE